MVDASLSISAPRPPPTARRAPPAAAPFADALPSATALSPPGTGLPGAIPTTADPANGASSLAPAPASAPPPTAAAAATPPTPAAPGAAPAAPSAFHVLLSELNPLQYVPVVGTIYRAVTGDTIPEAARFAGGLVVSGLTGGPVGLAMNLGATLIEHLVGIDPEKLGDRLLAELGIGPATHAAPTALASAAPAPALSAPVSSAPASSARPWSAAQLAAYGVTDSADGTLRRGTESGADVLNSMELARIASPAEA